SGYVAMPYAVEWSGGVGSSCISGRRCAQEKERGTVIVASDNFGKRSISDLERNSNIVIVVPGTALVIGDGDVRMSTAVGISEIHAAFRPNSHGRIAGAGGASGHWLHGKGEPVVHGYNKSLSAVAAGIGNV